MFILNKHTIQQVFRAGISTLILTLLAGSVQSCTLTETSPAAEITQSSALSVPTDTRVATQTNAPTETNTPTDTNMSTDASTSADTSLPDLPITEIGQRVLPSPNYVSTVVRAPVAWEVSRGTGVKVGVIQSHAEDLTVLELIAPDAEIIPLEVDAQLQIDGKSLTDALAEEDIRILVVLQLQDFDPEQALQAGEELLAAGITIFVGVEQSDPAQANIVTAYKEVGILAVGCLDSNGNLIGDEATIQAIQLFAPDMRGNYLNAPLVTAGVGALVLSHEPDLTPAQLNERLLSTADEMYVASDFEGQWQFDKVSVDEKTGDYSPSEAAFHFKRINAANAVGAKLETTWPVNALNAPTAWQTATGNGVTVAVLDQGFHIENPAFEGHLVDKVAFVEGKTFEDRQNFHGTSMAKIVLDVAPDASLMFLLLDERADEDVKKAQVDAIDYAIANGAKVITNSNGPWSNTPEIHAAIDRAIDAGVVYVWFHYNGSNPAVIRPGHFFYSDWEVGAFDRFFESDKPSNLESGLSETSPQIAGIAALILQNEPDLTPMQVKQRILETATVLPGGFSLADAAAAVENRPSGRSLPSLEKPTNGHMHLVYQEAGSDEKLTLEVTDQQRNWSLSILPPADVLMVKYQGEGMYAYGVQAFPENQAFSFAFMDASTDPLETSNFVLNGDGFIWNMNVQDNYQNYYQPDRSGPPISVQVTVEGEHVHLHWESSEGLPLYRMVSFEDWSLDDEAGYLLYEVDVEGDFLPIQVLSFPQY